VLDILSRLGEENELRSLTLSNQAWLCFEQHQTERGLAIADRAIALAHANMLDRTEGLARSCRSRFLIDAGRHDEAEAEARSALSLLHGPAVTVAHEALAIALHYRGDDEAAIKELRQGLAVAISCNFLGDAVQDLLSTAALILEHRDMSASLMATEAAAVVFDARRSDIGGAAERIAYDDAARHRRMAAAVVRRRLDTQDMLSALATADRYRARSLAEAGIKKSASGGISCKLPPPDAPLLEQIAFIASTARAFLKSWGITPPMDPAEFSSVISGYGRNIVLFDPDGTDLRAFVVAPGPPLGVKIVTCDTSMPEVLELTDSLRLKLGIAIAARSARGHLPPQSIEELESVFAEANSLGEADLQLDELRQKLHDALFSKILPLLKDGEPVVVVPYRELAVIPLSLLAGADGRLLLQRHPLSVLPSIASLNALGKPGPGPPFAVIVGDPLLPARLGLAPLPGAADEACHIKDMLEGKSVKAIPLFGANATEEKFRAAVAGARLVHLACHAALREPASASPLFLVPSENDDGLLLASEVSDLRLDGALVVLSACQSGLGRATADGILGLGRAFIDAGARTVVLSLWRVGDTVTSCLMREFYAGLLGVAAGQKKPLDVAAALQRAQLLTIDRQYVHPSSWGPWAIVGDGGWRLD
jgi:CHAT domain-containing protein